MIVTNSPQTVPAQRSSEALPHQSDPQNNRLPLRLDGGEKKEANFRGDKLTKAREAENVSKIDAELISNHGTAASLHKNTGSIDATSSTRENKGRNIDLFV